MIYKYCYKKYHLCFYILINGFSNYEIVGNQWFITEKEDKFKYINLLRCNKELLKMNKIKPLTELEDDLANKDRITLKTFLALCIIEKINVIIVHKKKIYETINNDSDVVNIIYQTDEPLQYSIDLHVTKEKMDDLRNNYFKITNFGSGLKSIYSYKVDELLELCSKLGIDVNNKGMKKLTKKDIYEMLVLHF